MIVFLVNTTSQKARIANFACKEYVVRGLCSTHTHLIFFQFSRKIRKIRFLDKRDFSGSTIKKA